MNPWLETCRLCVETSRACSSDCPRVSSASVLQQGVGGDDTTAIDQAAEDAVVERLAALGEDFVLVSEELGERAFGGGGARRVVVDPIDGSVNAKRGIPFFSFSLAVADGLTMGDVTFRYVYDFGSGEEWTASVASVHSSTVNGSALRPKETIEILSFEGTTTPAMSSASGPSFRRGAGAAARDGIVGTLPLCHLAAGRVDGVVSLRPARSVDIAAAQLLVANAGSRWSSSRIRRSTPHRSTSACGHVLPPPARPSSWGCSRALSRYARRDETGPRHDPRRRSNVIDPGLRRPVTELDMVSDVVVEEDGSKSR